MCGRRSMTIAKYREEIAAGKQPFAGMSECLHYERVPPEDIIGFAKLEKFFSETNQLSEQDEKSIRNFINKEFNDVVFFADNKNVGLYFYYGDSKKNPNRGYEVRIIYDKEKIKGKEGRVSSFFAQFESINDLLLAAQKNNKNFIHEAKRQKLTKTNNTELFKS